MLTVTFSAFSGLWSNTFFQTTGPYTMTLPVVQGRAKTLLLLHPAAPFGLPLVKLSQFWVLNLLFFGSQFRVKLIFFYCDSSGYNFRFNCDSSGLSFDR